MLRLDNYTRERDEQVATLEQPDKFSEEKKRQRIKGPEGKRAMETRREREVEI